jgi:outer membrane protein assembly factor BamD
MRPQAAALTLALAALSLPGCKTLQNVGGDPGEPTYGSDAESNLKSGNEALEGKNFIEAEKYFEYVKSKYPYLEAAKEAELKLADTDYERDRFIEARDRYHSFIKLHPAHAKVDYAAYRAALTHHREIPSDLFILPPSREKDQVEVHNTLKAMNEFIRQYPESQYLAEAKRYADEARKRLCEHELYVARFYRKRERWGAVVGRLNTVVETYSGLGFDEEALFGLHEAYTKLGDPQRAQETLRKVIAKLPGTAAAQKASKLLGP